FVNHPADFSLKNVDIDPGHEFDDVVTQLCGAGKVFPDPQSNRYPSINNEGFTSSYDISGSSKPTRIMDCFEDGQLPILHTLAREFVVCDNWHASLPGPTWPNRFFLMAATSGGLCSSPTSLEIIKATLFEGYGFEHGNFFDALDKMGVPWVIYEGDKFPLSFALKGMGSRVKDGFFKDFSQFDVDIKSPSFAEQFIFIEPRYGKHSFDPTGPGDFFGGNSMHPLDDVRNGEALVKSVYDCIRNSPYWDKSVLLILFDEHGGFYDHAIPGQIVPPGDNPINATTDECKKFQFDQLGVRVPAIIVSPLIPKGLIDHTPYDHTSALKTMEILFQVDPLTNRDKNANDFMHLFTLSTPRPDTPQALTQVISMTAHAMQETETLETLLEERKQLKTIQTVNRLAISPKNHPTASRPQVGFAYIGLMRVLHDKKTNHEQEWKDEFSNIQTYVDAAKFMNDAKLKIYHDLDVHQPGSLPDE
ncbi:MAG TPA: alkaline phosphatase family protein, partial [Puia sp.]|nr:alkaline phosphatase family protein [Puia sp.]